MIDPNEPVSPMFPTETVVEDGHVVPGLAEGEEGLEVGEAAPEEEVLPQKPQTSPEQPTASQFADHN